MGVYTTIPSYIRKQQSRLATAKLSFMQAHEYLATEGRKDFQRQTGGPLKKTTLRRMGHPYARAGGTVAGAGRGAKAGSYSRRTGLKGQITKRGQVRPLPINIQSGKLRRGIKLDGPNGNQRTYRLYADAPYAKYVLAISGTKRMVPRGLLGPRGHLRRTHLLRKHVMKDSLVSAHRR